jgi:hypothetical protein
MDAAVTVDVTGGTVAIAGDSTANQVTVWCDSGDLFREQPAVQRVTWLRRLRPGDARRLPRRDLAR